MIRRKPFDHLSSHPAFIMNKYDPSHCSTRNLVNSAFMRRRVAVYFHSLLFRLPCSGPSTLFEREVILGANSHHLQAASHMPWRLVNAREMFFFKINKCCTASTPRNAVRRQLSKIGSYRPIPGRTARVSESASACVIAIAVGHPLTHDLHSPFPNLTYPFTPLSNNPRTPFLLSS